MKNIIKFIFCVLLILTPCICMAENVPSVYTFGDAQIKETKINMQVINGENALIMPSSSDGAVLFAEFPENSDVYIKGGSVKFIPGMKFFRKDGNLTLDFTDKNGVMPSFNVKIYFSENVPAIYLVSDNPAENGRAWVEASADKSNKATGIMVMQTKNGETVYSGTLSQIKGRGNSTWTKAKKPYQIKLAESTDLLQSGNEANESKTWVLLANYLDPSLLNNSIVLGMGKDLGMKFNIENKHVDLYYDGEYRGSYLLSEKVEVGSGRVDVLNIEDINSALNPEKKDYPVKTAVTANGAEYTYCDGMISPEDVTGGYLLEMDYEERAKEEICYFKTTRGQYVVVKSPELASKEEMDYIASFYQEYEDAVYNGGINPTTGKAYSEYVDRESVAAYYLMNEFSKARDFFGSSAYLYKNSGEDKMNMGPLWDYDLGFTETRFDSDGEETPYGLSIYNTQFGARLAEIPDFSALLNDMYTAKLLPLAKEGLAKNFKDKSNEIKVSREINSMMWHNGENADERAEKLFSFIGKRADYLEDSFEELAEMNHSEKRFIDVLPSKWYYDCVNGVAEKGYMNGVTELCFDPYSPVRRSEAAQVIFNMSYAPKPQFRSVFSDVNENDWFASAAVWCADSGIVNGFSGGKFLPARYVTREELICMLYRYKKATTATENLLANFSDGEKVSSYANDAFNWAVSEGILVGDGNKCLNPKNNLTRAELAAILTRIK